MVGYYLIRGFNWADSTSIQEAAILVDEVQDHCPELAGEVRSYLMRRARLNGPDWSVADVQRPQWWRRRQYGWDEALPLWDWPGGRAWQDLRLHHLSAQGWEADEIATVFQLRVRGIRERLRDLKAGGVAGAALPPGWGPLKTIMTKKI